MSRFCRSVFSLLGKEGSSAMFSLCFLCSESLINIEKIKIFLK